MTTLVYNYITIAYDEMGIDLFCTKCNRTIPETPGTQIEYVSLQTLIDCANLHNQDKHPDIS